MSLENVSYWSQVKLLFERKRAASSQHLSTGGCRDSADSAEAAYEAPGPVSRSVSVRALIACAPPGKQQNELLLITAVTGGQASSERLEPGCQRLLHPLHLEATATRLPCGDERSVSRHHVEAGTSTAELSGSPGPSYVSSGLYGSSNWNHMLRVLQVQIFDRG